MFYLAVLFLIKFEFRFCKVNEFEFSFFKLIEFEFQK